MTEEPVEEKKELSIAYPVLTMECPECGSTKIGHSKLKGYFFCTECGHGEH